MNLKEYIEKGEKLAGKQIELARMLGVKDSTLRLAKMNKCGLHDAVCMKLADFIEVDRLEVIAASNLVTEKDEERRKIFESCFEKTNRAAGFLIAVFFVSVISITTPSPASAQPVTTSIVKQFVLCKIDYMLLKWWQKLYKLSSSLNFISKPLPHHSHFAEYPYIR